MAIDPDLQEIEKSIMALQDSLSSLAKVVLQKQKRPRLAVLPAREGLCSIRRILFLC